MAKTSAILFSPDDLSPPDEVSRWLTELGIPLVRLHDMESLMGVALRSRPRVVVFDAREKSTLPLDALRHLKSDSYTGVVPAVVVSGSASRATKPRSAISLPAFGWHGRQASKR